MKDLICLCDNERRSRKTIISRAILQSDINIPHTIFMDFLDCIINIENLQYFAEKFWGEEKVDDCGKKVIKLKNAKFPPSGNKRGYCTENIDTWYTEDQYNQMQPAWQYHLQQMVLAGEPIKYLEKFL